MGQTLDDNLKQLRELTEQVDEFRQATKKEIPFQVQLTYLDVGPYYVSEHARQLIVNEKHIFIRAILGILEVEQKRLLEEITSQLLDPVKREL